MASADGLAEAIRVIWPGSSTRRPAESVKAVVRVGDALASAAGSSTVAVRAHPARAGIRASTRASIRTSIRTSTALVIGASGPLILVAVDAMDGAGMITP